jgi:hypothetical protein
MTLVSLAVLAALSTTTDRLGASREAPEVLPAAGTRTGFQATRTTRWVRFNTPACTQLEVSVSFARKSDHRVLVPSVDHEFRWDEGSAEPREPMALKFEVDTPTFDLGLAVHEYSDVTVTWSSGPCNTFPASGKAFPDWLQRYLSAKAPPSQEQLIGLFKKSGLEFEEGGMDEIVYTAPVTFEEMKATLQIGSAPQDFEVIFEVPENITREQDGWYAAMMLSVLARLGPVQLVYIAENEDVWRVKKGAFTATLTHRTGGLGTLTFDRAAKSR